ncbi:MAG: hypothetical protein LC790_11420 [Actinobacteria bacterium]|nr:hypothetical protein [Actinomycetota bacterium]
MDALAWIARVGATPFDALALVMGCSRRRALDHVRRLEEAGLIARAAMRRGDGTLVLLTRAGALEAGCPPRRAIRTLAPHAWTHASGCAWASAWLELRGRAWVSEREVLEDDLWRYDLRYQDHRGTVRVTHRPDLIAQIAAGPVAIEVELVRKAPVRLRGICAMYAQLTEPDGPLAGVIYICDRGDVSDLVTRCARDSGLASPALSMRSLRTVLQQTHAAASTRNEAA